MDVSAHGPTFGTCALTRRGSQALVRMQPRLPMHVYQGCSCTLSIHHMAEK